MSGDRVADYLEHMREAAADALAFVEGLQPADFYRDKRTQRAVIMSLVIIGEAAAKVMDESPEFAAGHAEVPWRAMRGMRNRIAHGYFEVNLEVVWHTVRGELPRLLEQLTSLRDG